MVFIEIYLLIKIIYKSSENDTTTNYSKLVRTKLFTLAV